MESTKFKKAQQKHPNDKNRYTHFNKNFNSNNMISNEKTDYSLFENTESIFSSHKELHLIINDTILVQKNGKAYSKQMELRNNDAKQF